MFFKNMLFAKLSVTCRQITGSSLELAAFFMLEWLGRSVLSGLKTNKQTNIPLKMLWYKDWTIAQDLFNKLQERLATCNPNTNKYKEMSCGSRLVHRPVYDNGTPLNKCMPQICYLVESCFKLHREEALASDLEAEKVFLLYFKMSSWGWYLFRHVGDSVQTRSGYTMQSKTTHKDSGDKRCSSSVSSFETYFETRSIQIHLDCLQTVLNSVPVHPVWPPSSCFSLPSIWLNM